MLDVWVIAPEDLPIPPIRGGSVQIYIFALITQLLKYRNLSITLISPSSNSGQVKSHFSKSGYQHTLVPNRQGHYLKTILKLIRKNKPDIVQIENRPKFVHAIRIASPTTKIILNMHSTTFVHPKRISPQEVVHAFAKANRVICNSQYLKARLLADFTLLKEKENIIVIYPGVDIHMFKPPAYRSLHTPIRLLYVGRIIRQKGLHVLLRSLPLLLERDLNVHLTVIGRNPPWEAKYGKFVRTLANHQPVKWRGFIDPIKLIEYYQKADIFICPSQNDEAFGLVNIEAMATGLPAIVSKIGGMTESVTAQGGVIVDKYRTPLAFAEAIAALSEHVTLWKAKTIAARNRAERFSWENTAEQFYRIYQSV